MKNHTLRVPFPPPNKIKFVAVVKGNCWLTIKDKVAPLHIKTGDVFVLPAERAFVLAGDLNAPQTEGLNIFADATDKIAKVGDGDDFFAVGAHIALDPERGGLLSEVLPPLLHVGSSSSEASAMRWLLDQLVKEVAVDRPGAMLASNLDSGHQWRGRAFNILSPGGGLMEAVDPMMTIVPPLGSRGKAG